MSTRIGIYDLFAFTIPGSIYIGSLLYMLVTFGYINLDLQGIQLSVVHILILGILAYLLGILFDSVSDYLWYKWVKPKNIPEKILSTIKERYPKLNIEFDSIEWPLLMARIRRESMDVTAEIDKFKALGKMLNNISFSFLILSVFQLVLMFIKQNLIINISLFILFIAFSLIFVKRAIIYDGWFYSMIYEATITREQDKVGVNN